MEKTCHSKWDSKVSFLKEHRHLWHELNGKFTIKRAGWRCITQYEIVRLAKEKSIYSEKTVPIDIWTGLKTLLKVVKRNEDGSKRSGTNSKTRMPSRGLARIRNGNEESS